MAAGNLRYPERRCRLDVRAAVRLAAPPGSLIIYTSTFGHKIREFSTDVLMQNFCYLHVRRNSVIVLFYCMKWDPWYYTWLKVWMGCDRYICILIYFYPKLIDITFFPQFYSKNGPLRNCAHLLKYLCEPSSNWRVRPLKTIGTLNRIPSIRQHCWGHWCSDDGKKYLKRWLRHLPLECLN